jgi:YVTN family beta-propeller protein
MKRIFSLFVAAVGLVQVFATSATAQYAYISTKNIDLPWLTQITVINTVTNTIVSTLDLHKIATPGGVAVNPGGTRAYITVDDGTVAVIDTSTNTVIDTVRVGGRPTAVALNPAGTRVYVGDGDHDSVHVINTSTNAVIATVYLMETPVGIAVNPAGTRVYVAETFGVSVIDTSTNSVTATVIVGSGSASGVAVNPAGTRVYTTNGGRGTVSVIDTSTNAVIATVIVGKSPFGIAMNPAGTRVYVANGGSNSVSVIDTVTNTVTATVGVGSNNPSWPGDLEPYGIAVNPAGTRAYVTNYYSDIVSLIDTATDTLSATVNMIASYPPNCFGNFIGGPNFSLSIPDLTIAKTHTGDFTQGQIGARYVITISNVGSAPTSGAVTMADKLPGGLAATAISGTGWTCLLGTLTCTRTDALAASASYPAITVTVNVGATAPNHVTNTATVAGGGETKTANDIATDFTPINVLPINQTITFGPLSNQMPGASPFQIRDRR